MAAALSCRAQDNVCRDSMNVINQAYNSGEWMKVKTAAEGYAGKVRIKKFRFFNDHTDKANLPDCIGYLPQVYYYLIKSCMRLYEPDSARFYYKEALLKELQVNLDTADSDTRQYLSLKRKQFSIGAFAGSSINTGRYHFNYKLGLQFGQHNNFRLEAYGEASFNQRYFNHVSNSRTGAFGKNLKYDPRVFPNYNFTFKGMERFIDLLYFAKFPLGISLSRNKSENALSYMASGVFLSYYLNSSVNSYYISKNTNASDTTVYQSDTYKKKVDGLGMDLGQMYGNRFSYGIIYGYGIKFRMTNNWEMFTELRYTLGSNFKYKFSDFNSYRAGVSYLTFLVGLRKNHNYLKDTSKH